MRPVSARTALLLLFAAACAALDAGLTGWAPWSQEQGPLVLSVGVATAFSLAGLFLGQALLAGLWLAWGEGWWSVRFWLATGAAAGLTVCLDRATRPSWSEWLSVLALVSGGAAGAALVAWPGRRLQAVDDPPPAAPSRRQFSLRALFGWATAAALALGVWRGATFPWQFTVEVLSLAVGSVGIGLLASAAVFGGRPWAAGGGLVALGVGWGLACEGLGMAPPGGLVLLHFCQAATVLAGCGVLRGAGYRLERPKTPATLPAGFAPPPGAQ